MKYKFTVKYKNYSHSEDYSPEFGYDSEWLENYDESELIDKSTSWAKVRELN